MLPRTGVRRTSSSDEIPNHHARNNRSNKNQVVVLIRFCLGLAILAITATLATTETWTSAVSTAGSNMVTTSLPENSNSHTEQRIALLEERVKQHDALLLRGPQDDKSTQQKMDPGALEERLAKLEKLVQTQQQQQNLQENIVENEEGNSEKASAELETPSLETRSATIAPADPTPPIDTNVIIPEDLSHLQVSDLDGESFSACALVMDENIRLGEWIAYHYFTLPLRTLIITSDPRSKTSPSDILDKWRPFMNITIWSDEIFLNQKWLERAQNITDDTPVEEKRKIHRQRQAQFYKACSMHLKKQEHTWTAYHDVDEYIALDSHQVNNTQLLMRQPGSILRFVKHVRATQPNNTHFQMRCITIPRTYFGAMESRTEAIHKDVPAFVDPNKFNTLRYRHFAGHVDQKLNGPVKSIVDVSQIPPRMKVFEVHRPIHRFCSTPYVWESLLTIHHYVGSWEVYSFKDDARRGTNQRSRAHWEHKASIQTVKDNDDARPWIQGFVDWIGEPLAKHLLQDIGPPANLTKSELQW